VRRVQESEREEVSGREWVHVNENESESQLEGGGSEGGSEQVKKCKADRQTHTLSQTDVKSTETSRCNSHRNGLWSKVRSTLRSYFLLS
jgi:hypothetical protein